MNYAEARDRIYTGDLIAIRSPRGILATLTRWITRSPYTHTGIALWSGRQAPRCLLLAESKAGGNVLTPLSQYAAFDFDVFDAPTEIVLSVEPSIWALLRSRIGYDVVDLLRIGMNRLFGVPLPARDDGQMICSALSASIWLHAGWRPLGLPSIPAPADVAAALGRPPLFEVRAVDPMPGQHD